MYSAGCIYILFCLALSVFSLFDSSAILPLVTTIKDCLPPLVNITTWQKYCTGSALPVPLLSQLELQEH